MKTVFILTSLFLGTLNAHAAVDSNPSVSQTFQAKQPSLTTPPCGQQLKVSMLKSTNPSVVSKPTAPAADQATAL